MTDNNTLSDLDGDTRKSRPILGQILFFLGVSFMGGGIGAGFMIGLRDGVSAIMLTVSSVIVLSGLAMLYAAIKVGDFEKPSMKSKTGQSQLILLLCVILGAGVGMYVNISGATDRFMDGDFSLTRIEGIVALVLLFLVILPIGIMWQRRIDEHESAAAKNAGYIALNVYIYGYLGVMIAASAGLMPWIEGPVVFTVVLFTFLFFWIVKRSG